MRRAANGRQVNNGTETAENNKNAAGNGDTANDGQVKFQNRYGYDFSKSFAEQIDDFIQGNFNINDTLIVSGTPEVLQRIGLPALPVTFSIGHLRDVINAVDRDHNLGINNIKKLPQALANPVAVIDTQSANAKPNSIVCIINLGTVKAPILASVVVSGLGFNNGQQIDSNAVTSVHIRANSSNLIASAIEQYNQNGTGVYYINKQETVQLLKLRGYNSQSGLNIPNGYVNSISSNKRFVNTKVKKLLNPDNLKGGLAIGERMMLRICCYPKKMLIQNMAQANQQTL